MSLGGCLQPSPWRVLEENNDGVVQQSHIDVLACEFADPAERMMWGSRRKIPPPSFNIGT